MAPRFFEIFTERGRLRREARARRRELRESSRPESDRICARVLNEANSLEDAKLKAEQFGKQAGFGIAEILIIIQIISALYQLAKMMGWLKKATPKMIETELAE